MASEAARASGRQSKGSSRATPASSEHITLRNVWPQAESVESPASPTACSTSATCPASIQWSSRFWRVVRCSQSGPKRREARASARAWGVGRTPPGMRMRTMKTPSWSWVQTPRVLSA